MGDSKLDLLQGKISGDEVLLNQGTIYASLARLQQRGWIDAEWSTSDNNRKAKFYSITDQGRKQLAEDASYWERLKGVMDRVLARSYPPGQRLHSRARANQAKFPVYPESQTKLFLIF
jgi:DNA-binding PadR family transcriptional regulator